MRRAAAGLVVALLALAAAEGLARSSPAPSAAAPIGTPVKDSVLMDGDPWLLWSLTPGDHEELGVEVHVNALGMRDRDRGPRTGPRALALGDSSVYGFGVRDGEVFTSLLEQKLGAEVINGATPGWSSYQALNLLDMRGLGLEPDLLIVASIWSDNNFDSFSDRDLLASYAGWRGSRAALTRRVLERSALFRWLDWTLRVAPQQARARKVGWQVGGDDPRSGRRRVDIQSYAENLDTFCERMARRDGGVAFVVLPNREDVEPRSHDPAWGPYRDVMRATAARWSAPIIEGPRAFQASGRSADALFLDQMHPTPLGHTVLAEAVGAALASAGWPERTLTLTTPTTPIPAYTDRFEGKGDDEPAGNVPGAVRR